MRKLDIEPGIYDLSNEQYHDSMGISRSAIMTFKKSPLHYWYENLNSDYKAPEPTPAMIFGSALHTFLLEPRIFEANYAVLTEKFDRRTKAGKEGYAEFERSVIGKTVLDADTMIQINEIAHALHGRKQVAELLQGAQNETSIYWIDPDSGLLCKARPDIWHSNMVVDLKTTVDASFRACQSSIYSYGYHIQAAMIIDGIKHTTGKEMDGFIDVFVEKIAPYASGVYILEEAAIEAGRRIYKSKLLEMRECFDKNEWNSYNTMSINLPNWANYIEE